MSKKKMFLGKNLRIPERVPCRLTPNVVNVFGLGGVDGGGGGVFRGSCEHTLQSIRDGRETLMTLLEAFVYDPLVDWTPAVHELKLPGQALEDNVVQDKRDMHTELTFSMLSVRVAEIRSRWLENQVNAFKCKCHLNHSFIMSFYSSLNSLAPSAPWRTISTFGSKCIPESR